MPVDQNSNTSGSYKVSNAKDFSRILSSNSKFVFPYTEINNKGFALAASTSHSSPHSPDTPDTFQRANRGLEPELLAPTVKSSNGSSQGGFLSSSMLQ